MMIFFSLEFPARPSGLTGATHQTREPGFTPTGGIVPPVPAVTPEKRKVHALEKHLCESRFSGCGGRLRL
jgi:hypothetical protein